MTFKKKKFYGSICAYRVSDFMRIEVVFFTQIPRTKFDQLVMNATVKIQNSFGYKTTFLNLKT